MTLSPCSHHWRRPILEMKEWIRRVSGRSGRGGALRGCGGSCHCTSQQPSNHSRKMFSNFRALRTVHALLCMVAFVGGAAATRHAATMSVRSLHDSAHNPSFDECDLQCWLQSLVLKVPDETLSVLDGLVVFNLTDFRCAHINLSDLQSDANTTSLRYTLNASNFTVECSGNWTIDTVLRGGIIASIYNDSSTMLQVHVAKLANSLPGNASVEQCLTALDVNLNITGASLAARVAHAIEYELRAYVRREIDAAVCTAARTFFAQNVTAALRSLSNALAPYVPSSLSPPPPPLLPFVPAHSMQWRHNAVVSALDFILNYMIGVDGAVNVNEIVRTLVGKKGTFHVNATTNNGFGWLPATFNTTLSGGDAALSVRIDDVAVGGLDTWQRFDLMESVENEPQVLRSTIAARSLSLNVSFAVRVQASLNGGGVGGTGPWPLAARALEERGELRIRVSNTSLSVDLLALVNSTLVSQMSPLQKGTVRCWPPVVNNASSSSAQLETHIVAANLSVGDSGDSAPHSLERQLDAALTRLLTLAINGYTSVLPAALRGFADLSLRNALDAQLAAAVSALHANNFSALASTPACPTDAHEKRDFFMFAAYSKYLYTSVAVAGGVWFAIAIGLCCTTKSSSSSSSFSSLSSSVPSLSTTENGRSNEKLHSTAKSKRETESDALLKQADASVEYRSMLDSRHLLFTSDFSTSLALHRRTPPWARYGMPLLVLMNIALFVTSNSSVAASVYGVLTTSNGQDVIHAAPFFEFTLKSSVVDMWNAGVYALAAIILGFSGIWPYVKLLIMLFCWLVPAKVFSVTRREQALMFIDALGKWSLIDTYVLVMMCVAFRFHVEVPSAHDPSRGVDGGGLQLDLLVRTQWGFYVFLLATVLGLILTHVELALHRHSIDPLADLLLDNADDVDGDDERVANADAALAATNALAEQESLGKHSFRARRRLMGCTSVGRALVVCALLVALSLVCVGVFIDGFEFKFLGLAGAAFAYLRRVSGTTINATLATVRRFSLLSIGADFATTSTLASDSISIGIRLIQVAFFLFAAVVPLAHLLLLIALWIIPMRLSTQRHAYFAAEVLNAWSALDVFVVSVLASFIELRQFTAFIVGNRCAQVNPLLRRYAGSALDGDDTCFDTVASMLNGLWVLLAAAVIYAVIGTIIMRTCHHALLERTNRVAKLLRSARGYAPTDDSLSTPLYDERDISDSDNYEDNDDDDDNLTNDVSRLRLNIAAASCLSACCACPPLVPGLVETRAARGPIIAPSKGGIQ